MWPNGFEWLLLAIFGCGVALIPTPSAIAAWVEIRLDKTKYQSPSHWLMLVFISLFFRLPEYYIGGLMMYYGITRFVAAAF